MLRDDDDDDDGEFVNLVDIVGDFHVWFRGVTKPLGRMTYNDAVEVIREVVWLMGVGETDQDPLYVFSDYHLVCVFKMVHVNTGFCLSTRTGTEFRVFNVLNHEDRLIDTVTMVKVRDAEPGELGELDEMDGMDGEL